MRRWPLMDDRDVLFSFLQTATLKRSFIMAIDGRSAAGKTTLAEQLKKVCKCNVIHMDDYFLPFEKRTPARMEQPGGNIDFQRLIDEVLIPLTEGKQAVYRPYDCHNNKYLASKKCDSNLITIVEGSYSCHPKLREFYELCIFMDISKELQIERLKVRNPIKLDDFKNIWIPREERYFDIYKIRSKCDWIILDK